MSLIDSYIVFDLTTDKSYQDAENYVVSHINLLYKYNESLYSNVLHSLQSPTQNGEYFLTPKVLNTLHYMTGIIKDVLHENNTMAPLIYKDNVLFVSFQSKNVTELPLFTSFLMAGKQKQNTTYVFKREDWPIGKVLMNNFLIALYVYAAHDENVGVLEAQLELMRQMPDAGRLHAHFTTVLSQLRPPQLPSDLVDILYEFDNHQPLSQTALYGPLFTLLNRINTLFPQLSAEKKVEFEQTILGSESVNENLEYCNTLQHHLDEVMSGQRDVDLGVLTNTGNSCFLDSVLMALLAQPNKFITSHVLEAELQEEVLEGNTRCSLQDRKKIQEALREITKSIRVAKKNQTCTDFREVLKPCYPSGADFSGRGQQSANEFALWLLNLFDLKLGLRKVEMRLLRYDMTFDFRSFIEPQDIFFGVTFNFLKDNMPISSYLTITAEADFSGHLTYVQHSDTEKVIDMPYLIISIERREGAIFDVQTRTMQYEGSIKNTPVLFTEFITLPSGRALWLSAVVIFHGGLRGGHYVACLKLNNVWYYYNDIGGSLSLIGVQGSFDELLAHSSKPKERGVLFFYT